MSRHSDSDSDDEIPTGGGIAGDWRAEQPRFDSPMTWSLPVARIGGVTIRIHWLFLVLALFFLIKSLINDARGVAVSPFNLPHTAIALAALLGVVLIHELGHIIACRQVGGHPDEILLWPLGGLAACEAPRGWHRELITAAGGPAANVVLGLMTGTWLTLSAGWKPDAIIPNPLTPHAFTQLLGERVPETVFIVHWVNWIVLLLNLAPVYPLDGGAALRAFLSRTRPHIEATRTGARCGFIGALMLAIAGAVVESWSLCFLGIFGGYTCWSTLRRIEFGDSLMEATAIVSRPNHEQERSIQEEARERAQLAEEKAKVDAILEKIKRLGPRSLSWRERRLLRKATRRLRGE